MSCGLPGQRHKIRRRRRRSPRPASGQGAGHPYAGRHAASLPVPLYRPHESLPHRRDHRRCAHPAPVPRPRDGRSLCRHGPQTPLHGLCLRPHGVGRTGLVPRYQMDRKTGRSGTRIPHFRTAVVLPRRIVDGAPRAGDHGTGALAQSRKRHAGHLSLDRETFERARRQGHVPDHLQCVGAGQRPYPRLHARRGANPLRADPTARRLLQHPFPAVARTAAAGTVQAEIRRTAGHPAQRPVAPHGAPGQKQRFPVHEGRGRLQHLLQRKATVPAHRSAETGHQGDPAGHRHGLPDEPPVAGRRRQRQDPRGADVDAAGRGQRLPGLHDGAHRDPRPPAFRHHHAYARRHGGEGRHPHRRLEGQGAPAGARRDRLGRGAHPDRHARPDRRPGAVRQPGVRGDRRAAPLRRGAARPALDQKRAAAAHPRDDRHADSPHAGHDPLRRPR